MVWWLAATTPCLFKCVLLLVLIHSVIVMVLTSSECNQTRFYQTCFDGAIHESYIHIPNDITAKTPSISCNSQRWFQSPDGGPCNISLSPKHTIDANNLQLNLSNISGSDEGIYGCMSDDGRRDNRICIQVYGKAVFASCSHELTCTENETLTLPANGGSVSFNATVIHIGGGSCGYRQNFSFVKLIKINETTGERSKPLYICKYGTHYYCGPYPEDRNNVNLTRGHSGFEFIFTLFNVTTDDVGTYIVEVERKHPGTAATISREKLEKIFRLVESLTSTEITPTTSLPPPTTSEDNTTIMTSTNPPANVSQTGHSVATILGAIGAIGAALFVITIIIMIAVLFRKSYKAILRKQIISEERTQDVNPSSPIYLQDEQNQSTMYNIITIAYNHNGNESTVTHTPNPETFIGQPELPTPNDTMSINGDIELADSRNMNSHPEMV